MGRNKKAAVAAGAKLLTPGEEMRVFISGVHGQHPIEVGIAYFFRGHYLYGRNQNPLEPVLFSSKNGKPLIAGTTAETAPAFVRQAQDLVFEEEIGHLYNARFFGMTTTQSLQENGDNEDEQIDGTLDTPVIVEPESADRYMGGGFIKGSLAHLSADAVRSLSTASLRAVHSKSSLHPVASSNALHAVIGWTDQQVNYYPHDRARYLSMSAPGSKSNSVPPSRLPSRAVTPSNASGLLRQDMSYTRLLQLQNDGNVLGPSKLTSRPLRGSESNLNLSTHNSDIELAPVLTENASGGGNAMPRSSSARAIFSKSVSSRRASRKPSLTINTDTDALFMREMPRRSSLLKNSEEDNTPTDAVAGHNSIIGTGRPRRASVAMNRNYNRNTPPKGLSSSGGPVRADLPQPSLGDHDDHPSGAHRPRSPVLASGTELPTLTARIGTSKSHNQTEDEDEDGTNTDLQTHTRFTKCPLHDNDCDGETVLNLHITEQSRRGRGFKDLFPTLMELGRTMVDWETIAREEKAKIAAEGLRDAQIEHAMRSQEGVAPYVMGARKVMV